MPNGMTKDDWVVLFREIGLDQPAMRKWHVLFEQRFPEAHQSFMEWLGMSAQEISGIRAWSAKELDSK